MPRLNISVAVFPGFSLVRINLEVGGYRVLMFPIHGISQRIHSGSRDNVNRNVKRVYHFINIIFVLNGGKNCKRMQFLLHEQSSRQLHQKSWVWMKETGACFCCTCVGYTCLQHAFQGLLNSSLISVAKISSFNDKDEGYAYVFSLIFTVLIWYIQTSFVPTYLMWNIETIHVHVMIAFSYGKK